MKRFLCLVLCFLSITGLLSGCVQVVPTVTTTSACGSALPISSEATTW
mgnify:CR=1 FL=1